MFKHKMRLKLMHSQTHYSLLDYDYTVEPDKINAELDHIRELESKGDKKIITLTLIRQNTDRVIEMLGELAKSLPRSESSSLEQKAPLCGLFQTVPTPIYQLQKKAEEAFKKFQEQAIEEMKETNGLITHEVHKNLELHQLLAEMGDKLFAQLDIYSKIYGKIEEYDGKATLLTHLERLLVGLTSTVEQTLESDIFNAKRNYYEAQMYAFLWDAEMAVEEARELKDDALKNWEKKRDEPCTEPFNITTFQTWNNERILLKKYYVDALSKLTSALDQLSTLERTFSKVKAQTEFGATRVIDEDVVNQAIELWKGQHPIIKPSKMVRALSI